MSIGNVQCCICGVGPKAGTLNALPNGIFICDLCIPQSQVCSDCSTPIRMGGPRLCAQCVQKRMMQAQRYSRPHSFYPGMVIPSDPWMSEAPKISNESVFWETNLEPLGIPWNFYNSLVIAAKALANDSMEAASIDKDGWLKLLYKEMTVKLKITEITVEPPEGK